eukprot:Plantae.Rhodophyta-Purpureofilum_apyrenoidigerum.ctg1034.p1 GENE.Plantae.Rhodophyta-Purpureofilum_apyrenoidigerum.ctg1034~~Plantae.Rhodophyta-Purpureofilum_apyrenoidigerum.ctg1034.p1  ORF type:complete len:363 (+),score=68.06 Plantae.Rhodophyta-Purpureofilum_apyrenoidigerum.ctg1034:188-1276(+)
MAFVTSFLGGRVKTERVAARSDRIALATKRQGRVRMVAELAVEIPDVLKSIIARKKEEVTKLKAEVEAAGVDHPIAKRLAGPNERSYRFSEAIYKPNNTLTVIAEIKRRSPSKGHIAYLPDPALISRTYYEAGAAAISVLTDLEGFGGTLEDLKKVVVEQSKFEGEYPTPCPVLRKDFTIDKIQIAEAAVAGADAVLLIVSALGAEKTAELLQATHDIGIEALVEVHDEEEVKAAVDMGAKMIGVNNRNLRTFEVSLETAERLIPLIPEDRVRIAESGISGNLDAWMLRDMGYNAILVGETLCRAYESSAYSQTMYQSGYNQAKGLIKAFRAKGSVEFGPTTTAAFYGKGEGAKETLGEMSI